MMDMYRTYQHTYTLTHIDRQGERERKRERERERERENFDVVVKGLGAKPRVAVVKLDD